MSDGYGPMPTRDELLAHHKANRDAFGISRWAVRSPMTALHADAEAVIAARLTEFGSVELETASGAAVVASVERYASGWMYPVTVDPRALWSRWKPLPASV